MDSAEEIARRYFLALAAQDLDAAVACWAVGGVDRLVGQADLVAPEGIRAYFSELFAAFPDFRFEIVDATTEGERCAVRWRAHATFAGPGRFQGFAANGATVALEGCDVVTVRDGVISGNVAYLDGSDVARQLGLLPPDGSAAHQALAATANARTKLALAASGSEPEAIAPGVWIVRGGVPRTMNVYLIEEPDGSGVTVFDGGTASMGPAIARAGARLGGIRRVVLGHADCDHRGGVAKLAAPIYVHPLEVDAARSASYSRDYWNLSLLRPWARPAYRVLAPFWDGGALEVQGTVEEGDEIAGFRVVNLPGHAPGLIGLFRDEDRLALVSDTVYTLDVETTIPGAARVPHPAFNWDTGVARLSILKLAALDPAIAWPGHVHPVSGDGVKAQLERAAEA